MAARSDGMTIWRAKALAGLVFIYKCIIYNHLRSGGQLGRCMESKIVQSCSNLFKNPRFSRENGDALVGKVQPLYKGGMVEGGGRNGSGERVKSEGFTERGNG
jgi:hypothetical protein